MVTGFSHGPEASLPTTICRLIHISPVLAPGLWLPLWYVRGSQQEQQLQCEDFQFDQSWGRAKPSSVSQGVPVNSRELAGGRLQYNTTASSVEGAPRAPGPRMLPPWRRQLSHTAGRNGSSSLWLAG